MKLSAWRAALRIARRDALRAKGRSALVIAMIAVPVLGASAADITARSAHLSVQQSLDRRMGSAAARVDPVSPGIPLKQAPDPDNGLQATDAAKATAAQQARAGEPVGRLLKEALPPGATAVPLDAGHFVTVSTAYGQTSVVLREADLADPLLKGMVTLRQGRLPGAADEVAVTSAFLSDAGLKLGGTTTPVGSGRPLKITAVVEYPGDLHEEAVLGRPGAFAALLPEDSSDSGANGSWLVTLPGDAPFSWAAVQRADESGFSVASRAVIADPPPDSSVTLYQDSTYYSLSARVDSAELAVFATVVGMALLEIVLLAGPAFAVGARRSRRQLGLIAAGGGDRSHIRAVVLGGGVVLGTAGALVGVVLGAVAVALGRGWLEQKAGARFGHFSLQPLDLLAVVAVGLVTGLLAAVVPAIQAARQPVVASLSGRGSVRPPAKRLTVVGVAAIAVGTVVALAGTKSVRPEYAITAGSMIGELGVVACTPFLVGQFGRLARLLPLGPRLALRDSTRNRGRTAPAVAAVMAAVAGAVAVSAYQASGDAQGRAGYHASAPSGAVMLTAGDGAGVATRESSAVERSISGLGPRGDVYRLRYPGAGCVGDQPCADLSVELPADQICPAFSADGSPRPGYQNADAIRRLARTDARCRTDRGGFSEFGTLVAGDATVLRNLAGVTDPAAVRALEQGKLLVQDARYIKDGRATISVGITGNGKGGTSATVTRKLSVPAFALSKPAGQVTGLMSPATARSIGLGTSPAGSIWLPGRSTGSAEKQRAQAAVTAIGLGSVQVERGYQGSHGAIAIGLAIAAAVVAIAAAGITTGLASADSQADLATLAAVGAAPRIRRTLSGFQCAVIAAMGALLGAAAGLVPAAGLWWSQASEGMPWFDPASGMVDLSERGPLTMPWSSMAVIVLGLPVLAWLLAAGFTRSRVVLSRRTG
ncbi:FtsX-like permease family protein [Streptacidiphilus carbonis]|uniref:FtsX-like permease family protein n=1 Tax=Streptacidiphilus carbonis TaxID=105422 RepID=UPI0005A8BDE7|nr:FtsX-like permease family protein [Streptacidiphilus carbonis]